MHTIITKQTIKSNNNVINNKIYNKQYCKQYWLIYCFYFKGCAKLLTLVQVTQCCKQCMQWIQCKRWIQYTNDYNGYNVRILIFKNKAQ